MIHYNRFGSLDENKGVYEEVEFCFDEDLLAEFVLSVKPELGDIREHSDVYHLQTEKVPQNAPIEIGCWVLLNVKIVPDLCVDILGQVKAFVCLEGVVVAVLGGNMHFSEGLRSGCLQPSQIKHILYSKQANDTDAPDNEEQP